MEQEAAEVEAEEEAFNPDMAATSVTLGATILLCRENDTQVQVPIFRRGRDTELTEVEVTTEDGSAKLGEHYLPIVTTNGGKLEEVGRPVTTVSFEPGAQNNLQMVAVPLRHSRAYDATVSFALRLRLKHKNRASGDGGGKVQVGPIVSTRVRIINVDPFPSGHLIIDDGSRSLGAKMEDTFGLSLAQMKRRVSGIATYGPQLAEFVDLHESDDARFFYFSKQQRAKLGLVWSFFLEVNRPHQMASFKYLLAKLYGALYSMFLLPWLSKTLIDSVVGTLRWDTALWVSMVAATAYALLLLGLGVAPSSLLHS